MFTNRMAAVAALVIAMCASAVAPAESHGWTARTEGGHYDVTIAPRVATPPLGRFHEWEVRVARTDGAPLEGATTVEFDGGMPHHGHGLPSQPQVTDALGGGRWRVEGVKFSMAGNWLMSVRVTAPGVSDVAWMEVWIEH